MLTPLVRPLAIGLLGSDALLASLLGVFYDLPDVPTPVRTHAARYRLAGARLAGHVDPRFVSVAIDASQVVGGHWWSGDGHRELLVGTTRLPPFDFSRPRLGVLARALAPGYLRVGGTEADRLVYDMGDAGPRARTGGDGLRLDRGQWDALHRFVADTGLSLMFTASAGPLARDADDAWSPAHLEPLLRHSAERGYRVPVWELGNEVNAFAFTHGPRARLSGRRYAADVASFGRTVRRYYPNARIAAAAAFAWPVMGETPGGFTRDFLRHVGRGGRPDILTWHYYPQQSRRCVSATRRASPTRLLEPLFLDEIKRVSGHFRALSARVPGVQTWLGETGHAQCGGEPGVSDRFAGSLWWLDQLGVAAASGEQVVVRQTLTGSDYGLLDVDTLAPRPDYWGSLLWKRTMGTGVVALEPLRTNPHLRVHAHCHPAGDGRVSVLAINLASEPLSLTLVGDGLVGAAVYRVEADGLDAARVRLNGRPLSLLSGDRLPELRPARDLAGSSLTLSPRSYAFVVPGDRIEACRSR